MLIPIFKLIKSNKYPDKYVPSREKLIDYIRSLKPGTYDIIIRKPKKIRSLEQNRYYWGVIIKILAETWGWDAEELHEVLKFKFNKIPGENGLPDRPGSTTDLSTIDFENYLEEIRRWALTEYQIYIPLPNEIEF